MAPLLPIRVAEKRRVRMKKLLSGVFVAFLLVLASGCTETKPAEPAGGGAAGEQTQQEQKPAEGGGQ